MSTNRGMDKEDVVHMFNGMLLSHKKEQNWVICTDIDGSIERHRAERENWNLEKWYNDLICKAEIETHM